ncbi:MAG: hypothetical protein EAZ89_19000 [Bacteroidetes bacterium]|nr:MAG: hypothetical protein EAZ89_19000 [Bacteroidota bacterium]
MNIFDLQSAISGLQSQRVMQEHTLFRKVTKILSILALSLVFSCAKEKDTFMARLYHSTTSYFNGYYNADYLFKETIGKLEAQYKLPEQGFIEVVYYGTEDEVKTFDADLEKVIKKNDAVMFKHPKGRYIDDCRLLNGKTWIYRQNYSLAFQNFSYLIQTYPDSKRVPEAWFWTAVAHYRDENPEMTKTILEEQVPDDGTLELDKDLQAEIALFRARLLIENKKYAQAAELVDTHIELISDRQRRARAHFLLGQLYAETDNFARSLSQFSIVGKYSDDYALTFGAKIRIARLYVTYQKGADEDNEVYKYLNQLLKDEKNLEYQDQIYYEFALLELKKEKREAAMDYLRKSLVVSSSNQRQKALSYYKLGQIYFTDLPDYPNAQAYYDSAASVITPKAPEFKEIKNLAKTLKEYITHKQTIAYQDSMLWLASLPAARVDSIVDVYVKLEQKRKEEEAERLLKQLEQGQSTYFNPELELSNSGRRGNSGTGAVWYFDNPAALASGRREFEQVWGKRANEDDWRRRNKSSSNLSSENPSATASGDDPVASKGVDSTLVKQYGDKALYYKDIPRTEEARAAANARIESALYQLGQVYAQKLNEPDSAIRIFEMLLSRYSASEYVLRTRYALYKLYSDQNNPIAEVHRNVILNEFPNTVYAYLILGKDPKELRKDQEDYAYVYDGLFKAYYNRQYETSLGFSEYLLSLSQFGDNEKLDLAELHYIRGMSYGYTGQRDSLKAILTYVVQNFPEADVAPRAQETLNFLTGGIPERRPKESGTSPSSSSAADPSDPRFQGFTPDLKAGDKVFVLLYVDKTHISKDDATAKVSDFNSRKYKDAKLKVFTFLYKENHLLPYISSFSTIDEAKKYVNELKSDAVAKNLLSAPEDKVFYITNNNFKLAYGQKRMEDYILYYESILK